MAGKANVVRKERERRPVLEAVLSRSAEGVRNLTIVRGTTVTGLIAATPQRTAVPHVALRSFAGIVPKTTDWKTLGATAEAANVPAEAANVPRGNRD